MNIDEQDDLADAEREKKIAREAALEKRLKEREGVRFFASVAASHAIRLSALCFYVVVNTRTKHRRGKPAQWAKKAEDVAKAIGSSRDHVYRLVHDAKDAGLLNYTRTPRQLVMWVTDASLYDEYDAGTQDKLETRIGRFEPKLVKALGMNGSLLYSFIKYHSERDDGCRRDHRGFKRKFPWMSPETIRKELVRLVEVEVLKKVYDPDCEHPRYVMGVPLDNADVEYGVRMLTEAEFQKMWKKRLQSSQPEDLQTRPPEDLQTPAEDLQTRPEKMQTQPENLQTPNKPHAISPTQQASYKNPKQITLPTPAAVKPPAVVPPSASVSDKGPVSFASIFEEDDRHKDFGQQEPEEEDIAPVSKPKLRTSRQEVRKQEQAAISPDVLRAIEERNRMEDEEARASMDDLGQF